MTFLPLYAAADTTTAADSISRWWQDDTVRSWVVAKPLGILLILCVAVIGSWLLRRLITKLADNSIKQGRLTSPLTPRKQHKETDKALARTQEARRTSRIQTLAGVGRSAVAIFVWVWAALAVLDKLGVNVAPLVASAGVVGVALGFGAQALVKDFLSGIFMLMEDQYGIGDTIDLGNGVFGDVESISLRITTVRDIDGALWYVRNGEIMQVANHSDRYSVARVQVPIALSNDPTRALHVITDAADAAARNADIRDFILAKPTVNGMSGLEVDHMSYRVSVKTLPGKQWDVQRALQAAILTAMQAEGVSTPYPRRMAIFDLDESGTGLTRKEE